MSHRLPDGTNRPLNDWVSANRAKRSPAMTITTATALIVHHFFNVIIIIIIVITSFSPPVLMLFRHSATLITSFAASFSSYWQ
ncbi:unnamed protein product [Angiostrongylus costaricensis]|uniref:Uncharacterized protein n=1 Tax=Angiostrongylus costaricensis TaxID=334426 RepID=A0A0R3PVH0_ANGCS|nr:unnamed protein product [Angiostrongylus costaricensis]